MAIDNNERASAAPSTVGEFTAHFSKETGFGGDNDNDNDNFFANCHLSSVMLLCFARVCARGVCGVASYKGERTAPIANRFRFRRERHAILTFNVLIMGSPCPRLAAVSLFCFLLFLLSTPDSR